MKVKGNLIVTGDVIGRNVPDPDRFYLTVKQSDDTASFSGVSLISFNTNDFYLNQNDPNTDEVNVNFRGTAGGGGGGSGVTFTDGTKTFSNATTLNFNESAFYLSPATDGEPVLNLKEPVNNMVVTAVGQTVSNGSNADINWDFSERIENGATWFPGGDSTDLTVPTGVSKIYIEVQVDWNSNTVSDRNLIRVRRNGGENWHGLGLALITSSSQETNQALSQRVVSDRLAVIEGDVITVNGINNSSSNRDIFSSSYIRIVDITQSGL